METVAQYLKGRGKDIVGWHCGAAERKGGPPAERSRHTRRAQPPTGMSDSDSGGEAADEWERQGVRREGRVCGALETCEKTG